jgi:hypothetical protein
MNFNELVKITTKAALGSKVETKGRDGFDFLSWAHSVHIIASAYPDFTFEVKQYPQIFTRKLEVLGESVAEAYTLPEVLVPFNKTSQGIFVEVSVTANKVTRTQVHPILDGRNQPIANPTSFQINTSIQRCLAKAIALHGVGLSLYAGEDLEDIV